jgi:hypothetical protein
MVSAADPQSVEVNGKVLAVCLETAEPNPQSAIQ